MGSKGFAAGVVLSYLLIRFGLERQLDSIHLYASLVFELLFSLLVVAVYRSHIQWRFTPDRRLYIHAGSALALGWVTYRGTLFFGLPIPFDFTARETLVLLIVVAPLLEEFLHRLALWKPFEVGFPRNPGVVVVATSLLFAFGHFWAYFQVPPDLKTFVVYQTLYTFLLSLWWGRVLLRYRSVAVTIVLHFLYNLGFFLGFRTWALG